MAALLRQELPQVAGFIRNPTSWKDLYYFFDAVDIWVEGAVFLYFVVSHIAKDNLMHHRMQQDAMVFQYAGKWVTDNADRLAKLPTETDFLTLFGPAQRADIRGFGFRELEAMKEAIRFHHARFREKYNTVVPRAQCIDTPHQPDSHSACVIQQSIGPVMQPAQPIVAQSLPPPNQFSQNIGPSKLSRFDFQNVANSFLKSTLSRIQSHRPTITPENLSVWLRVLCRVPQRPPVFSTERTTISSAKQELVGT